MFREKFLLSAISICFFLHGCAINYVDKNGDRNIIGFAKIKISKPKNSNSTLAGEVLNTKSLGILVSNDDIGFRVSAGFNQEETAYINDNALIYGNPLEDLRNSKGQ